MPNTRRRGDDLVASEINLLDLVQEWLQIPPEGYTIRVFVPGDRTLGIPSRYVERPLREA